MHARIATLTLLGGSLTLGCVSGPVSSLSRVAFENATSDPGQYAPPAPAKASAAFPAVTAVTPVGPAPELNQQEAMGQIAPMLARLSTADAGLHAEVLDQLAAADPSLWSLTVQRALNTLEYREQLTEKPTTAVVAESLTASPTQARPTAPASSAQPVHLPATTPTPSTHDANVVQASAIADPASPASLPRVVNQQDATPETIGNPHFDVEQSDPATPELSWREHLSEAIDSLNKQSHGSAEAHERVRLQLLQLVAGETDRSVLTGPGLSAPEQGYWSNQVYALATLLSDKPGSDRLTRADAAARHQSEASAKLREISSLQVRNFVTCREVYGFGAYEPLAEARYAPGDQVVLYAEIDNYKSDSTAEGYRTTIDSSYRLIGLEHNEIVGGDFPEVDDLCLARRRDFHIQYGVTLPSGLTPGQYRLELTVRDRLGDKTGHDQLMLTIAER